MKKLYQARSACLLLALLFAFSWASAATIVPCSWDGSNATPIDGYSQDGDNVEFTLDASTPLVFKVGDNLCRFNIEWEQNHDATEKLAAIGDSYTVDGQNQFVTWGGQGIIVPKGTFKVEIPMRDEYNIKGVFTITRIDDPVIVPRYVTKFNGAEKVYDADEAVSLSLPEVIANSSQLILAKVRYNVTKGKVVSYEEYYAPATNPVPAEGGEFDAVASTTEAAITFATEVGAYLFTFDPATGKMKFDPQQYVAFLKYVKAITGADFAEGVAQDETATYLEPGQAFPAAVSAKLSDGSEVTFGPETDGTIPEVGGTFALVRDGSATVTSDIYANYRFSYTIDGDKIIVAVVEKTKVFPKIPVDFDSATSGTKKVTIPAGGAILVIRCADLVNEYNTEGHLKGHSQTAPEGATLGNVDGTNVYNLSAYAFADGNSFSFDKNNAYGGYYYLLPEGVFSITLSSGDSSTVTITATDPDVFVTLYRYELDGTMVDMTENADGTWSFTLQEVIGSKKVNADLTETKLRLVKVNYNDTQKEDAGYEYIVPSETDNRQLAENAVAIGGSYSIPYTLSDENNVITFEAARASYKVTVDPAAGKFTFTRLEYVAFPRYIMPNAPANALLEDYTRIPNDVTKQEYVRYQAGTPVSFSVVMSSQGAKFDYAPAQDVELVPGARFTIVKNGDGKVTVGKSAKYRLAYSLDADNNIVVSAADTQEVIETLEVWLTASAGKYNRALPLKVDPETGHFVGSIYNDGYSVALRTKDAEYNYYCYENYKDSSVPYREFLFSTTKPDNNNQGWTEGPYYSSNLFINNQAYWLQFDGVERADGYISMKITRVDADTVPANAIYDSYFLVVSKEDGSEMEEPMTYNGAYYAAHQTAAGERYHFRGKTTSIYDGKEYVVNQYPIKGININQDNNGHMLMTHCGGQTKYLVGYANAEENHIYSTPADIKGKPDPAGEYHNYMFNWYYFPTAESPANRRAIINDLDLVVIPDPVLDLYTSGGSHRKLVYNHLRYKSETSIHLEKGEKVWVAELDSDGGEISRYWSADAAGTEFDVNPGTKITLDDLDLFNPGVFSVHTLVSAENYDNAFVAPETGDYFVAVSVNRNDASDKVIKFTRASFPEYLYIVLNDQNTNEPVYGQQPDDEFYGIGETYARYIVRIPRNPDVAGYYDTTRGTLLEYIPGADGARGEYVPVTDPDVLAGRLDAEGNLTFYNGERFFISEQYNINNMAIDQESLDKGKTGRTWGMIYGGYGSGKENAVFRPGKKVRMYRGDMKFSGSGVIKLDNAGTLIPQDLFLTTENEDHETVYVDRNSYVFYIDLTSTTDPKYSWGETMDYAGVDYALYGEYADAFTGSAADQGKIPFVYHPQTGLYTLSLSNFYGAMFIGSASGGAGDAAHAFGPTAGQNDITDTSVPYPLFNNYDLDGNDLGGENEKGDNFFIITVPEGAVGSVVSKAGALGGRDVYVYENVTLVFDPYSHRLYVQTRVDEPDNKDIDPGKKEDFPMYMVFVRVRDDADAMGNKYRSWRRYAMDTYGYDFFMSEHDFEELVKKNEWTDEQAMEEAEHEFNNLTPAQQLQVAEAKIEFFSSYLEIAGYRQMMPLRDNNMHYLSGVWDADEMGNYGNGWIDTQYTNVAEGLSGIDESITPDDRKALSGLRYQMYLTDASECNGLGHESDWELHNLIAYFFGEKEPVKGESLLEYMSRTVCYGSSDRNRTLRLGRSFDTTGVEGVPTDEVTGKNGVIRIDRRSVGGRRATLFNLDGDVANTEETPMSPNGLVTAIDLRKDEGKIKMANQIGHFTFFVMKVMHNSRIFAEFDNSTANIWSKIYRQDDKMYLVFNDLEGAIANEAVSKIYENTQPRYVCMETVKKGEQLNRMEAPAENLPLNYVMKPWTERLGDYQRDAKDEYAGDGFLRFSANKIIKETDPYSYFVVSRKAVDDRGKEFNMHEVITHSYNWLPLAYDENGSPSATRKITWGEYGEKVRSNDIWKTLTEEAVLSAPLQINRTGYINFFTKDFLNRQDQGYLPTVPEDESGIQPISKAPARAAGESSDTGHDATGFLPTTNEGASVINDHISDLYVESATTDPNKIDESYVYRAHIVLAGGKTPVVKITDPTRPDGYKISYTGPVAKNDMIYLERSQINHVYTGVEDITVDTPAGSEFTAMVSVDGRRLTVSGASQISVFTVSGMALATGVSEFSRTVEPGVYIIVADGATAKVLVR